MTGNYISLLVIQATNLLLPIVTFPYLIRVLGVDQFGLIMLAQAVCLVLYVCVDFGFSLTATRRISLVKGDLKVMSRLFSTVLSSKLFIATVVFFLYVIFIHLSQQEAVNRLIYLWSYLMVVGQALFVDWFFQGIEKMKLMAILSFIAKAIFTILIFIFVQEESDLVKVPIYHGLGFIVAGILSILISLKYTSIVRPSVTVAKELFSESSSVFISNLGARAINTIPVFFLGLYINDAAVGVYSSMEKLITTTKGIFVSLYQALYPWLSKQTAQKQREYVFKMMPAVILGASILMIPFFIFGDKLLTFLYNDTTINENAYLFYILTVNLLLSSLFLLFVAQYFPAAGYFKIRLKIIVFSAIIGISLGSVFIYKFQLVGAVLTAVIMEAALVLFSIWFFTRIRLKQTQLS